MTDIKEHCCGADKLFDTKTAKKQYKVFLKKGPSRVTQKIIDQLADIKKGHVLIDVGGGIGALQWWFLKNGGQETYGVDASSGYLALAEKHSAENKLEKNTRFIKGDFTEQADLLPQADVVTLDKVICCYPNFESILNLACAKSNNVVSISYPMDGIISDLFRTVGVFALKIKGNPFKPYVHKVSLIREAMNKNGFTRLHHNLSFPWHIETYTKVK